MRRSTAIVTMCVLAATAIVAIVLAFVAEDAIEELEEPKIGVAYAFSLPTRCGVVGARFGGRFWRATPPLTDSTGQAPPLGWDTPVQEGTMRLLSVEEAEFRADATRRARFVVLPAGATDPTARCD